MDDHCFSYGGGGVETVEGLMFDKYIVNHNFCLTPFRSARALCNLFESNENNVYDCIRHVHLVFIQASKTAKFGVRWNGMG